MPLTHFQTEILALLAANRSEASHFAGGTLLNAAPDSPRYSHDFDIFHDAAHAVAESSAADCAILRAAGCEVIQAAGNWEGDTTFRKAMIRRGGDQLEIDWAADAACRFFPVQRDPLFGWRLHLFDMATNKALALCARTETRDYVDIVRLSGMFPLHAIVWAACGKDPGFTPMLLLDLMVRFARIRPATLKEIQARNIDPVALKAQWTELHVKAAEEITRLNDTLPDTPIGVAFLNAAGEPGWLLDDPTLTIHQPSVRGCLPRVAGVEDDMP